MKATIQMLCAAALLVLLLSGCRSNMTSTNSTTEMTTVPVTTETTMPETQPTTVPTTQPTTEMTTQPTDDATTDTTENDINGRAAQPTSASTPQNSVAGKIATAPSTSASIK